ncbi:hypothetical protein TNCV_2776251 [Trichonephila clavipes]|nr:hypothetical protein TNCV_2776251 [Trichonephila clavipes]
MAGLKWYWAPTHDMPAMIGYLDHWATAAWAGVEPATLVEGEERWKALDHSQGAPPQNWGGTEQNRTVTCMVLKAKTDDWRKNLALSRDEFHGL